MATPRYVPIQAPNLGTVGQILRGANDTFNQGISSANSLLEKYQAGKRAKNDAEVSSSLASISDEQSLDKYLQSGALDGLDISPELRQNILEFRGSLIDQAGQRAQNDLTVAQTDGAKATTNYTGVLSDNAISQNMRAQASEVRQATEFDRETAKYNRNEDRRKSDLELADDFLKARNLAKTNSPLFQDQVDSLTNEMLNYGYTGDQISTRMSRLEGIREQAKSEQETEARKARNEELQGNYLRQISSPENITKQDLISSIFTDPAYENNNERIRAAERLTNLGGGVFSGVLSPPVEDNEYSKAADIIEAQEQRRRQNNPQKALLDDVSAYSSDPVGSLIQELEIGRDGQNDNLIKQRDELSDKITELSEENNVSPAVAAIALRETFVRDPFGPNGGFITPNTYRRFPKKKAGEFIQAMLTQNDQVLFDVKNDLSIDREQGIKELNTKLRNLRKKQAKYKGDIPADLLIKIAEIEKQISEF